MLGRKEDKHLDSKRRLVACLATRQSGNLANESVISGLDDNSVHLTRDDEG
jgi:hypothetical protein